MHPTAVKHLAILAMSFTACESLQVVKFARDIAARIEARRNYEPNGNWDPLNQAINHEPYTNSLKVRHTHKGNANMEARAPKRGGSKGGSSSDSDSDSGSGGSYYGGKGGKGGSSCKQGSCSSSEKSCNGGCIPLSATCCTFSSTSSSAQYCQSNQVCKQRFSTIYYCCPQSDPSCDYYDTQANLALYGSSSYCSSFGDSGAVGAGISAGALVAAGVVAGAANLMV